MSQAAEKIASAPCSCQNARSNEPSSRSPRRSTRDFPARTRIGDSITPPAVEQVVGERSVVAGGAEVRVEDELGWGGWQVPKLVEEAKRTRRDRAPWSGWAAARSSGGAPTMLRARPTRGPASRAGARAHRRREEEDPAAHELARAPQPEPKQIVPTLADRGEYVASESSLYGVLERAASSRTAVARATWLPPGLPASSGRPRQWW